MKITRLRTTVVEIPIPEPVGVGYAQLRSSGLVLVFLETDEGLVGEGLVFSLNALHIRVLHTLVEELAPLVVGLDPTRQGRFTAAAAAALRFFGTEGFSAMACAGIEEALLDLRAKAAGLSVARLLGAGATALPVYASGDLWVSLSIDELQRNARRHLDRGFRAMKIRLSGQAGFDLPRVGAVRDAIGPDALLLADANQKMTVPQAIRLGRALEEFRLTWLEEPVSALDHAGEAAVTAALDTAVATGESVFTSRGIAAILRHRAADVVMPDLQRMGGPGEFLKAATLAEQAGVQVSNHLFSEMSVSLLATLSGAPLLEHMEWIAPVYRERLAVADGQALVPDRPGWGFSFDPAVVASHRM